MKKNVFMILFVMFVMACFALAAHQPLQQNSEQTELTVDNHIYDVAIATIENQSSYELQITEGVAISTGGVVSQTRIESNGLNVNNIRTTPVETESLEFPSGRIAIQQTQAKDYYMKRGRAEDYSIYAEWLAEKTFLTFDSFENVSKADNTHLKVDGTSVRQLNNIIKQV